MAALTNLSSEAVNVIDYVARLRQLRPLQESKEQTAATALVKSLGLPSHHDAQKNWDTFKCFTHVVEHAGKDEPVFDAGSGSKCVVLQWLAQLGYQELYACDIQTADEAALASQGIKFSVQDITKTSYPDNFFAAVTSVSVIEHNVPLKPFAAEVARVLKPGGILVVSTDYWHEPIDCTGIYPYGEAAGQMMVFDEASLSAFVADCVAVGLEPTGPISYQGRDRAVRWERVDRDYTFAFLAFRKRG